MTNWCIFHITINDEDYKVIAQQGNNKALVLFEVIRTHDKITLNKVCEGDIEFINGIAAIDVTIELFKL